MSEGPKLTMLGRVVVGVFLAACAGGAYYFFVHGKADSPSPPTAASRPSALGRPQPEGGEIAMPNVEIGIAYGTEKRNWLEYAVREFAARPEGKRIKVNLIPKGSLEGAQSVYRDEDKRINVWSPASALYKDVFVSEWQIKKGGNPILKEEMLALTPMVFVYWDERYQGFMQKYKAVSFGTIGQALQEKGGWDAIAKQPEWGLFKFGHTHPGQSNSGLMTLVLMAYERHNKTRDLTLKDILDVDFQGWMQGIERGASGMSNSTGNMMRDMVLRGPSSYDALFLYESVVIDYLKAAEGRWGGLHVIYPRLNMWNDNPYYILDVPWSTKDQKLAAEDFLRFLMSESIQKQALTNGFRPGNLNVRIKDLPDSPFVLYEKSGLKIDLATMCDPPKAEVINNLLAGWQRSQGTR